MKDQILEPDTGEKVPQEVIPTNYEKLANALRRDMRDASEILLSLRKSLTDRLNGYSRDAAGVANGAIFVIDYALAALDCTDHIVPESGEDGTD